MASAFPTTFPKVKVRYPSFAAVLLWPGACSLGLLAANFGFAQKVVLGYTSDWPRTKLLATVVLL